MNNTIESTDKRVGNAFGFTLIELMITVAIVGIIASIALPSYLEQVRTAKRSEATNAAVECAGILERRFTLRREYASDDCDALSVTLDDYQIAVTHPGGNDCESNGRKVCFLITVTPRAGSSQSNDAVCTAFTLNETGGRDSIGTGSSAGKCWRS